MIFTLSYLIIRALDIISTTLVISQTEFTMELNPFVRLMMEKFGLKGFILVNIFLSILALVSLKDYRLGKIALKLFMVISLVAVIMNFGVWLIIK